MSLETKIKLIFMENKTEVSNELILQAHKEASRQVAEQLEKECPELFKTEIELNTWWFNYKNEYSGVRHQVFRVVKIEGDLVFGEDFVDSPSSSSKCLFLQKNRLATKEEIESHLIKEAEKRGFKDLVKVNCLYIGTGSLSGKIVYGHNGDGSDDLWYGTNCIYSNGKWATILSEPKVRAVESKFKFGDSVNVVDGRNNMDKKTGEKRAGINSLFNNTAIVIEANLHIYTYPDLERVSDKKDWMYSDLLLRFETGEEVYTSSLMCRLKQPN